MYSLELKFTSHWRVASVNFGPCLHVVRKYVLNLTKNVLDSRAQGSFNSNPKVVTPFSQK